VTNFVLLWWVEKKRKEGYLQEKIDTCLKMQVYI